jgi:hypothetical protein
MQNDIQELSPQFYARASGILWLLIIAAGLYCSFVWFRMMLPSNESDVVHKVAATALRTRIAVVTEVLIRACVIALAVMLYALLKPVNRYLSLMAALLGVMGAAIASIMPIDGIAAAVLSTQTSVSGALDHQQLQTYINLNLPMNSYTSHEGMIFGGCQGALMGYLVFKSRYLPRTLGIVLLVGAVCSLANGIALLLSLGWAQLIEASLFVAPVLAGLAFYLWLLFAGVNPAQWPAATESESVRNSV